MNGYCIITWTGRQKDGFLNGGVLYQEPRDPDTPSTNWWPWRAGVDSKEQKELEDRRQRVEKVYGKNYQIVWLDR